MLLLSYSDELRSSTNSKWAWIAHVATITQINNVSRLIWNTAEQPQTIKIIEASQYGCVGDTNKKNINLYVLKTNQTTIYSLT